MVSQIKGPEWCPRVVYQGVSRVVSQGGVRVVYQGGVPGWCTRVSTESVYYQEQAIARSSAESDSGSVVAHTLVPYYHPRVHPLLHGYSHDRARVSSAVVH